VRTNIVLDEDLVEEAFKVTGARTKRELVRMALKELIRIRSKKNLSELSGRIRLRDGYNHKRLRQVRHGNR
jgi:Arc/MetJ family transcription regulator